MAFSAGLNGLQVDDVNRKNESRSSRQIQFVASKLVAACSTHVLTSKYAITMLTSTSYILVITFSARLNGLEINKIHL